MGQVEELAKFDADIQKVTEQRQKVAEGFTVFSSRIAAQIEKILKDAEVFDVIRALEVGRDKRRQDDQAQADALTKRLDELIKMRAAILEEKLSAASEETPPTV